MSQCRPGDRFVGVDALIRTYRRGTASTSNSGANKRQNNNNNNSSSQEGNVFCVSHTHKLHCASSTTINIISYTVHNTVKAYSDDDH